MAASASSASQLETINAFDDATKAELAGFLQNEQGKMRMQSTISEFVERCMATCQVNLNQKALRNKDGQCLSTCVNRFLDSSLYIVEHLQSKQQRA